MRGDLDSAIEKYRKGVDLSKGKELEPLLSLLRLLLVKGDFKEIVDNYREIIKGYSDNFKVNLYYWIAYFYINPEEFSYKSFRNRLKRFEDEPTLDCWIATLEYRLKNNKNLARKIINRILSRGGRVIECYNLLISIYCDEGNYDKAEKLYREIKGMIKEEYLKEYFKKMLKACGK